MIVAIATEGKNVAHHFGRCSSYTLVKIEGGKECERIVVENPGHRPGFLPKFLADKGVEVVIAGGMGWRAQNLFAECGIDVFTGASGSIEDVVKAYIDGRLTRGENICDHQRGKNHHCKEEA